MGGLGFWSHLVLGAPLARYSKSIAEADGCVRCARSLASVHDEESMRATQAHEPPRIWDDASLTALGEHGSDVFRARTRDSDRFVAVRLWCGASADEVRAARERVTQAMGVSHPMLATVEAYEERGNGALWIVSEYVPGPTLEAWSRGGRTLPLGAAVDFVRRLSQGVQTALEHGVAPHSINPRNLVVRRLEQQADLGLDAKLLDLEVAPSMRPETPQLEAAHFIAPETLAALVGNAIGAETLDPRAHVYACGALLYHLATGAMPFSSADVVQLIAAHAVGDLIAPRSLNGAISESLERTLRKALSIQPDERHANPSEFADALVLDALAPDAGSLSPPIIRAGSQSPEPIALAEPQRPERPTLAAPRLPRPLTPAVLASTPLFAASSRLSVPEPARNRYVPERPVSAATSPGPDGLQQTYSAQARPEIISTTSMPRVRIRGSQFQWWVSIATISAGVASYFAVLGITAGPATTTHANQHANQPPAVRAAARPVPPTAAVPVAKPASVEPKRISAPAKPVARKSGALLRARADAMPTMHALAPKPTLVDALSKPSSSSAASALPAVPMERFEAAAEAVTENEQPSPAPEAPATREPTRIVEAKPVEGHIDGLAVRGSLVKSSVDRAIERVLPQWTACYARSIQTHPSNSSKAVHVALTIDEMGRARNPRIRSDGLHGLNECVARASSKLASEAPDTGTVDVSFNLRFAR
jgi:serine/threonine-protein kinase